MKIELKDNKERKVALADIHRIKTLNGISDEDWRVMLGNYGVESSADMPLGQLRQFRRRLHEMFADVNTDNERAKWSKKVYAVVGSWLRANGWKDDAEAIRTVICRAAHKEHLSKVTADHLKQIYYAFRRKAQETEAALAVKRSMEITALN